MAAPQNFGKGLLSARIVGACSRKPPIEEVDTVRISRRITLPDLQKRILYTIGLVLLYRVLLLIPTPGIDLEALGIFFDNETIGGRLFGYAHVLEKFSICTLGIMPYLSAYMIVEILSLFIHPLKSWRKEGYAGRIKLKKIALRITFLFTLLAGFGNAIGFENIRGVTGETIVLAPGWSFRIIAAITLTAGTFLTILIAELITKKGIGHGLSVLIFIGYGKRISSNIPQLKLVSYAYSPLAYFLFFAIMVISLIVLIVLMEKSYRKIPVRFSDGIEAYMPLKLTSAGIMPVYLGSMLIGLPITIWGGLDYGMQQKLSHVLIPGRAIYFVAYIVVIIFLYYLLASFFLIRKRWMLSSKRDKLRLFV